MNSFINTTILIKFKILIDKETWKKKSFFDIYSKVSLTSPLQATRSLLPLFDNTSSGRPSQTPP